MGQAPASPPGWVQSQSQTTTRDYFELGSSYLHHHLPALAPSEIPTMISAMHALILAILAKVHFVDAASVYKMCKDNTCQDCPVGLTNAGTGYPKCVIY